LEYFREALNESWTDARQMFEAFDKCVVPIAAGACWLWRENKWRENKWRKCSARAHALQRGLQCVGCESHGWPKDNVRQPRDIVTISY
jgi:hypothetical protein